MTLITVGANDLEKSLRFYRDCLGLAAQEILGTEFGAIGM
ncbi:VOC family protein [Nitrosomonas sp. Is79A3]